MPYIKTEKDIKIYYNAINTNSKKIPIVFVHGFIVNWTCFKNEIKIFKKLNYPVIYFDLRGHGKSSVPSNDEGFSVNKMVDDLDIIIKKLGLKKVYLVGHSLGGIVNLMYTIKRKSKVKRLVVINSSYKSPKKNVMEKIFIKHHYLRFIFNKVLDNKKSKKIIEFDDTKIDNDSNKYMLFIKCILNSDLRGLFLLSDELFNLNIKKISEITCPTLIIESSKDEFFSYKEEISLRKHINSSIIKFFPGGHDIIMKKPKLISNEIEQFFFTEKSFFYSDKK